MNSLNDLNNYALSGVEFTDLRPTSFQFNSATVSNPTINVYDDFPAPTGIDLVKITNPRQDIQFSVNLANTPGASLSWTNPQNFTTTQAGNVYTIGNIRNVSDWNTIKNPTIIFPTIAPTIWTYTSTITYKNGNTKTWTTAVNVLPLDQLTAASNYYYPNAVQTTVTGTPVAYALPQPGTSSSNLSLLVTTSNAAVMGNLSSTGLNSSTWNNSTKTLTITGNINTVNSHLGNLKYWPVSSGLDSAFYLYYNLTNPVVGFTTTRSQLLVSQITNTISTAATDLYYSKNQLFTATGMPIITDPNAAGTGTYTYTIQSQPANAISYISANIGSWDNSIKKYTMTANRSQINAALANVIINPGTDVTSNFYTNNTVTTPSGNTGIRTQNLLFDGTSTAINNMAVSRYFLKNTPALAFPNTVPYISQTISPEPTYTVRLSSDIGWFGLTDTTASSVWVYSGTKQQINSAFTSLRFYPNKDFVGSGFFRYMQFRGGVTEVDTYVGHDIANTNVVPSYPNQDTIWLTGNGEFVPTIIQRFYLRYDVYCIGGGGGAGYSGGAGGGAGYNYMLNQSMYGKTYGLMPGGGDRINPLYTCGAGGAAATTTSGSTGPNGRVGGVTGFGNEPSANGGGGGFGAPSYAGGAGGTSWPGYSGTAGQAGQASVIPSSAQGGASGAPSNLGHGNAGRGGNAGLNVGSNGYPGTIKLVFHT